MSFVVVAWIEVLIALGLRWLILNERLEHTVRARRSRPYLTRDELTDLLVEDPRKFARSAPREWLKGLAARTQASSDPEIEGDRTSGNRGYAVVVGYIFLGTPLLGLVVGMIGQTSWELLVATLLLLQVVLLGYWLLRLNQARRQAESVALVASIGGIAAVFVATVVGALLVIAERTA